MKIMFYTTNKLRHSTYPCTPSGKSKALILLTLSILHLFSIFPEKGTVKKLAFFYSSFFIHYSFSSGSVVSGSVVSGSVVSGSVTSGSVTSGSVTSGSVTSGSVSSTGGTELS